MTTYICLRVFKLGKSKKVLKDLGFWRESKNENNRNALDYIAPACKDSIQLIVGKLGDTGFSGVAIKLTELQRKYNAAITDLQWQRRIVIN